ncbi:hypothetical protein Tco_0989601 [Tanacetum coccineum]|uniref:Uncharacterized protein n=1 Tax=Tanacetum coccineum TaxID=301880 RepID=A0ABQ5EVH6_9ASTR
MINNITTYYVYAALLAFTSYWQDSMVPCVALCIGLRDSVAVLEVIEKFIYRLLRLMCSTVRPIYAESSREIPQLEHFGLRCQEDTDDTGSYCHQSQSQHRSLNVLPGASPDSTDNPHYQKIDLSLECTSLTRMLVWPCLDDKLAMKADSSHWGLSSSLSHMLTMR